MTNIDTSVPPPSKKVKKIILLYEDGTYEETDPHPWYSYKPWQLDGNLPKITLPTEPFPVVSAQHHG